MFFPRAVYLGAFSHEDITLKMQESCNHSSFIKYAELLQVLHLESMRQFSYFSKHLILILLLKYIS